LLIFIFTIAPLRFYITSLQLPFNITYISFNRILAIVYHWLLILTACRAEIGYYYCLAIVLAYIITPLLLYLLLSDIDAGYCFLTLSTITLPLS